MSRPLLTPERVAVLRADLVGLHLPRGVAAVITELLDALEESERRRARLLEALGNAADALREAYGYPSVAEHLARAALEEDDRG